MAEQSNDVLKFLKQTGEDIRTETQKVLEQLRDPKNQEKMKEGLNQFKTWAQQTAEEAATLLNSAVKRLETTLQGTSGSERVGQNPTSDHDRKP